MSIYLQGSLAYGREAKIGPFRAAKMLVNTMLALYRSDYGDFRSKGMQIACVCACECMHAWSTYLVLLPYNFGSYLVITRFTKVFRIFFLLLRSMQRIINAVLGSFFCMTNNILTLRTHTISCGFRENFNWVSILKQHVLLLFNAKKEGEKLFKLHCEILISSRKWGNSHDERETHEQLTSWQIYEIMKGTLGVIIWKENGVCDPPLWRLCKKADNL